MMRAFAIAIGIATIRVVSFVLDMALSPAGFRSQEIFVLSLWSGWVITLGTAELWIRYTRFSSQVAEWPSDRVRQPQRTTGQLGDARIS
jgi:hypothetical protein